MNQFVLAFPIPVAVDEPFSITENVQVKADTKTLMTQVALVLARERKDDGRCRNGEFRHCESA